MSRPNVRTQAQIVDLLQSLQEKLGLSYLFIAHDLAIVRHVAHRVAVMFGEDHAKTGTPRWHAVAERHGVSCRFWPPES